MSHFNFTVWPKYYNLWHFSSAVVLRSKFFMCVYFQHFRYFGKSMEPKWWLNTFCLFFTHYWFTKVLKTPEKLLSGLEILSSLSFESRTGFMNLTCEEALYNKIVIGYSKVMYTLTFVTMCAVKKFLYCFLWNLLLWFCLD